MRTAAAAIVLCLAGCAGEAGDIAPPPAMAGIWTVTGHHLPGVGAMSDSAAIALYGRTIRLAAGLAMSGSDRCDQPLYRTDTVPRDSLLAAGHHLGPGALPMLDALPSLERLGVSCHGDDWTVPGGMLIAVHTDHALAPWDGAWLELTRSHDIRASGHGPGWQLELVRGDSIRMQLDSGGTVVTTPDGRETVLAGSGARMVRVITDAHDMGVMMEPAACIDATSGDTLPLTVTVLLDGERYRGCGGPVE